MIRTVLGSQLALCVLASCVLLRKSQQACPVHARGMPAATPALATLALQLLNRQLRLDGAVHDVADDARAALDVALYEQQKGPSKELAPPPMQVRPLTL